MRFQHAPLSWPRLGAWLAVFVLTTVAPLVWVRFFAIEAFEIDGPSMLPTLHAGDRLLLDKTSVGLWLPRRHRALFTWGEPRVGQLVILNSPADHTDIVKRVVGVGGDMIEVRDGRLIRNGETITAAEGAPCPPELRPDASCRVYRESLGDDTYFVATGDDDRVYDSPPIQIPGRHVYVLGDYRDHSNDSRNALIGPVPVAHVKGHVLFVYFSGAP